MPISELTDKKAVLGALAVCDTLGRDAFLRKYGFRRATSLVLRFGGRDYDSKAIAGVAYGIQHPERGTLSNRDGYTGGQYTSRRALERLGFEVIDLSAAEAKPFVPGETYNRRRDIHEVYGGQEQGGIITPKNHNVIFLITGDSGKTYGYADEEIEGVFHYFGEGQNGDMEFVRGNKAVRDHAKLGKQLLLFEKVPGGLKYRGEYACAGYEIRPGVPDSDKKERDAIVFQLLPIDAPEFHSEQVDDDDLPTAMEELYEAALEGPTQTAPGKSSTLVYHRSAALKRYVKARAGGVCEGCGEDAPFVTKSGDPYLEPHHTHMLSDGGPDHPASVIALCPTCHRRVHYGQGGGDYNEELIVKLSEIEPNVST